METPDKLSKLSLFDRIMKYQQKGAVMGTSIIPEKLRNGITEEVEKKRFNNNPLLFTC